MISFYSLLILGIIIHYIFALFDFDWQLVFSNVERLEKFSFFVIVLTVSLTMLMIFRNQSDSNGNIVDHSVEFEKYFGRSSITRSTATEIDASFRQVSEKVNHLTENLRKSENRALQE